MSPIVVFYIVLVLWTVFLASSATSLKGKDVEKETVYELTDKLSWVVGGRLLAFIPLWWKWITYSYV